jgi:hypothetical protein
VAPDRVAEDLLNDVAVCAGGAQFDYSEHLADPNPADVERDLVDLELIVQLIAFSW